MGDSLLVWMVEESRSIEFPPLLDSHRSLYQRRRETVRERTASRMPFRAHLTNIGVEYLGNYRTHPSMQRNIGDARGLKVADEVR
jgi:hypothetical protein